MKILTLFSLLLICFPTVGETKSKQGEGKKLMCHLKELIRGPGPKIVNLKVTNRVDKEIGINEPIIVTNKALDVECKAKHFGPSSGTTIYCRDLSQTTTKEFRSDNTVKGAPGIDSLNSLSILSGTKAVRIEFYCDR